MASTNLGAWLNPTVAAYARAHTTPPDDLQRRLIAETAERAGPRAIMQIAPDQGVFMGMIVRLMGARRAVEVGTFTGYSALCVARALPEDGRLLCCDIDEGWTSIGQRYWEEAGVAHKIDLRVAPALDTLRALPATADIDVAFIDADKPNYLNYLRELVPRLRAGGLIMVDNTLWSGEVANPEANDEETVAIRAFNDAAAADDRLEGVQLTVADGLTLLRKK